jgi:hypothetical protein
MKAQFRNSGVYGELEILVVVSGANNAILERLLA